MSRERKVKRLVMIRDRFEELADLAIEKRAARLDAIGKEDPLLREELEELLRDADRGGIGMASLEAALDASRMNLEQHPPQFQEGMERLSNAEKGESIGDRIGPYTLVKRIGEGGFGIVWLAEQQQPVRRKVALKIIKVGMDTREVVTRFEAERQALAMMSHPGIATVFDAGATETGRPYFVMELVEGIPINRYCDQNRLSMQQRLGLFVEVCHAVQHAHQKGIIHRDLKPSNVLVEKHDGHPVPKIIDFGIAKATAQPLTDQTLVTRMHTFMGTPVYTSPEQLFMGSGNVDTRTDIYSLGVILYELLTGRLPFDPDTLASAGFEQMHRILRESDPPRPSTRMHTLSRRDQDTVARLRGIEPIRLVLMLRGDLDWIILHCLEKERDRRYPTANSLAQDIEHYLRHEPIVARPPTTAYRVRKFIRRNKVMVSAATAVAAALVLGIIGSTWQAIRATKAEHTFTAFRFESIAEELAQKSELGDNTLALAHAIAALEYGDTTKRRRLALTALWKGPTRFRLPMADKYKPIGNVGFSPDLKWLATGSKDPNLLLWPSDGGEPEVYPVEGTSSALGASFSRSGRWMLSGHTIGDDLFGPFKAVLWDASAMEQVWDRDLKEWAPFWIHPDESKILAYNLVNEYPYAGFQWVPVDGSEAVPIGSPTSSPPGSNDYGYPPLNIEQYYPSTDMRWIVSWEGTELYVSRLNADSLDERIRVGGHEEDIMAATINANGELVSSADRNCMRLWSTAYPGKVLSEFPGLMYPAIFDPHSSRLFLYGKNQREHMLFYDLNGPIGSAPLNLFPIQFIPRDPVTAPGLDWVVVESAWWSVDREVLLYPVRTVWPFSIDLHIDAPPDLTDMRVPCFLPDGQQVIITRLGVASIIDLNTPDLERRELFSLPELIWATGVDATGERLLLGSWTDGAFLVSTESGQSLPLEAAQELVSTVAFSPSGGLLALGGGAQEPPRERYVLVLDREGTVLFRLDFENAADIQDIAFLSESELVVTNQSSGLYYWNFKTGAHRQIREGWHGRVILSKNYILTMTLEAVWLYDRATLTGRQLQAFTERTFVRAVAPDESFIVACNADGNLLVHHLGEEGCHFLPGTNDHVWDVWIDPDGYWIKALTSSGKVVCWPVPRGRPLHDLPLDAFLNVLRAQTNIRIVADATSPQGYREEQTSFPGWETVPTWQKWYSEDYMKDPPWEPMLELHLLRNKNKQGEAGK